MLFIKIILVYPELEDLKPWFSLSPPQKAGSRERQKLDIPKKYIGQNNELINMSRRMI